MRDRTVLLLKTVSSLIVVGVVVYLLDPARLRDSLRGPTSPAWWLLGGVLQGLILLVQAWTWRLLFSIQAPMSWHRGLTGSLMVNFAGLFLPGRFAARITAPFIFRRVGENRSLGFATSAVYVHTAAYLATYGTVAGLGLGLLPGSELPLPPGLLALPVAVYLGGGLGLFLLAIGAIHYTDTRKMPFGALRKYLPDFLHRAARTARDQSSHLSGMLNARGRLAGLGLLLLVMVALLPGLRMHALLRGLGVSISPWTLMLLLPAFYSVTILPISLGGIGLAEGSAIGVLTLLGVPAGVVVPAVLLDRVLAVYLPALLGWLLFTGTTDWSAGGRTTSDPPG